MKSVTPFLWFNDDLEAAVDRYTALFPESKVHSLQRGADGRVTSADFEIAGQAVRGLNGGPQFPHTEAFSFFVECDDQDEVDHYWAELTADGGQPGPCGWLKDQFGVSWQVVPTEFVDMVEHGTTEQVSRVIDALQGMSKIDLGALRTAYRG